MKQRYFIKFDRRINQIIGCQRATLILSTLEYWFIKKPNGFYKFIEPCSHRLYKEGDSWTENLGCHRTSFSTAFKKIGIKYNSRREFEAAIDKFQGKLYASYYDRYSNRTFFVRNHNLVNEFLTQTKSLPTPSTKPMETHQLSTNKPLLEDSLRTEKNSRSYIEAKNTSNNLSKDKSHAEEMVKKMIEVWIAIVEEGERQINLTGKRIAFLKKAFVDKFDSCLEKWKKYCQDIASSRFLMGEVKNFRATLDWVLKFENIQKIFEGNFGIGDRTPKTTLPSQSNIQEEILSSTETQDIKNFRALCLKTVGNAKYISYFKNLTIEFREEGGIVLMASHVFNANLLEQNCYSYLRVIIQKFGNNLKSLTILAPGEVRGRLIELERGGPKLNSTPIKKTEHLILEKHPVEDGSSEDELIQEFSLETESLRAELKKTIAPKEFPTWLESITVEDITGEGVLIAAFDDQFKANWCKERFSQQILKTARALWKGVEYLEIQVRRSDSLDILEEDPLEIDETSKVQQAIQSFKGRCLPQNLDFIYG